MSPVGPSSHVFLSNRAAALLSLKRYSAAATDARRAVALAPTFGKAHARLGQALYFLKDYGGAVAAYQDAIHYEPDNQVTRTYLEKARAKLERHRHREEQRPRPSNRGDDATSTTMGSTASSVPTVSTTPHTAPSVVTTDHQNHGVLSTGYKNARSAPALASAVSAARPSNGYALSPTASARTTPPSGVAAAAATTQVIAATTSSVDDPDLEEALRIQHRANLYLANKEYTAAIEEYTAALFLVPDDPILSPNLHLGRAHALNGSRRHERAKTDALLAIRLQPSPAAYSTLAKSLFYMKDFRGALDAFAKCIELLPPGESLGMFDRAYLRKAEAALEEEEASLQKAGLIHNDAASRSTSSVVPKLPPPRFVPREQALHSTPNLPPMPKEWPQQSPTSIFKCGPERTVLFLSESLGVKLNRGADGVVRVLWVAKEDPGSPIARQGDIRVGHVVREAAGVDLRRPITNIMWGDTVALIKMAPRPIALIVAPELSEVPLSVLDEIRKANDGQLPASMTASWKERPSPSSGDEPVSASDAATVSQQSAGSPEPDGEERETSDQNVPPSADSVVPTETLAAGVPPLGVDPSVVESASQVSPDGTLDSGVDEPVHVQTSCEGESSGEGDPDQAIRGVSEGGSAAEDPTSAIDGASEELLHSGPSDNVEEVLGGRIELQEGGEELPVSTLIAASELASTSIEPDTEPISRPLSLIDGSASLRLEEDRVVGGEILFLRPSPPSYSGWDNLRWLAFSGERKIRLFQHCYRLVENEKQGSFWSRSSAPPYQPRHLAIYDEPRVVLVLRKPLNLQEVNEILGLPDIAQLDESESSIDEYWIVESVVDPTFCKLRLSSLSTVSSIPPDNADERRKSCFELITPTESIFISTVRVRQEAKQRERSFSDSGAFLETSATETALIKAVSGGHVQADDIGKWGTDISWKHQFVLGTFQSHVVLGNVESLDAAIRAAKAKAASAGEDAARVLRKVIDELDDNGLSPLYYACSRRMSHAATSLVAAGADIGIRCGSMDECLAHVCARNLDHKTLSVILSASNTPSNGSIANAVDALGRTPMYVAATEGRTASGATDSVALCRCIMALEAWGGQFCLPDRSKPIPHPVSVVAGQWNPEDLAVVLDHTQTRYPLSLSSNEGHQPSLGALYQFPIHRALVSLKSSLGTTDPDEGLGSPESRLVRTLRLLLERSFEPNERLAVDEMVAEWGQEFAGLTPLQVLGSVVLSLAQDSSVSGPTASYQRQSIGDAAELLVRCGARLAVDPPLPLRRLGRSPSSSGSSLNMGGESVREEKPPPKLDSKELAKSLGGDERLKDAQRDWLALRTVEASAYARAVLDTGTETAKAGPPRESGTSGGVAAKACAICWKEFGALRNRKHTCRITLRAVCDACSGKRLVLNGVEHRVTDGQFLLARIDAAQEQSERVQARARDDEDRARRADEERARVRLERLEAEEQTNRDSLFGGLVESATSFVFGGGDSGGAAAQPGSSASSGGRNASELAANLAETRNALLERGDKLATLGEKSSQLVDSSADFARLAKELRKKSESQGLFW